MADKKKTTKPKKLHPGGSVPANRRDVGVPGGMKGFRERQRERLSRVPKTGMTKVKTRQEDITAQQRANRRALRLIRQRQRMMNEARRRFGQPTMPTAGIAQGRPIRGRTPMPGPAPDSERMKRFQKLMREQQARFNKMQKARSVTPRLTQRGPAPFDMTLDTARKNLLNQKLIDAASNRRKKPARNQSLVNKISNRPKRNPRTTNKK